MDSALSPREIQARIRSGASVDDVAAEAGVSTEQVEPFAVPVLAELTHVIAVAMDCPVRRHGDPGSHRGLGSIVAQVCRAHDMDVDAITWRCWRHQDRSWAVVAGWEGDPGPGQGQATFRFDLRSRYSVPQDVGARWLVDDRVPLADASEEARDPDKEPTIDLHDDLAVVRAVSDPARPTRRRSQDAGGATGVPAHPEEADPPPVPGMTSTDGVYDFVPSTGSQMDMLYEMMAGFQEDSVNIYEGFSEPIATPAAPTADDDRSGDAGAPAQDPDGTADQDSAVARPADGTGPASSGEHTSSDGSLPASPATPAEPRPGGRRKKRNHKRASIPSWDEIMFGGPGPQD